MGKIEKAISTYNKPDVEICLNCKNSSYHQIDGRFCKYMSGTVIKFNPLGSCGEWEARYENAISLHK